MIIFSSELFYMYSETKGEELASSFHFNWEQFTLQTLIFVIYFVCVYPLQAGHLVVYV